RAHPVDSKTAMIKTDSVLDSPELDCELSRENLTHVCVYCGKRLVGEIRYGKIIGCAHECAEMIAAHKPSAPIPFS
ncbi:MAG: hypothetical protein WA430_15675, partial [Acidobacteriaceae bacterium]